MPLSRHVRRQHRYRSAPLAEHAHASLDDDVRPGAVDDGLELGLLGLLYSEFVERLLEIIEKGLPLGRRDHKIFVRLLHGATRVLLRPARGPTDHFRDEIFEACREDTMMGLVHPWIRIQAGIDHNPIDKVIDHGGDAVDTAEPLVKAGRILSRHLAPPASK